MHDRSLSRELALLMLGQVTDRDGGARSGDGLDDAGLERLLQRALTCLGEHVREALDRSAEDLGQAQQQLLDSELKEGGGDRLAVVRSHLRAGLSHAETALNRLSASLEMPRLMLLADQEVVRRGAIERVRAVLGQRSDLDARLDAVMEGWRLARLPRIDRDILRLAAVDLLHLKVPAAVACNEAVELANRYSDEQGRRMINGVLRRFTSAVARAGV